MFLLQKPFNFNVYRLRFRVCIFYSWVPRTGKITLHDVEGGEIQNSILSGI